AAAGSMGERVGRRATEYEAPNNATVAAKVESELFRDPSIDKGRMNINVENGTVVLRGVAESAGQIAKIEAATRAIPGVRSVKSLLHTPTEPAEPVTSTQPAPADMSGESSDEPVPSNPGL